MLLRFSFLLGDMRCVSDGNFVKYEDYDRLQARLSEAERLIIGMKLEHLEVDDCWYSCRKAGGCNDAYPADFCTCGADNHNATIEAFLDPPKEKANGEA